MPAQRLTRQSLAALSVPDGKTNFFAWDTEVPGFGVKVSAGGSRRYVVQYRPAGERTAKRLTIGAIDTLTLDEARRQARTLLAKALTGNDPHAEKAAAKKAAAVTLGSVADAYLKHCEARQKPGTGIAPFL
ncbi:Arm DNA-binding domain-containing protein, partial [Methylobacterium platani]